MSSSSIIAVFFSTLKFLNIKVPCFKIGAHGTFSLPPWLTATAVSFTTFKKGTTPCDLPFVPLMCEPNALTFDQSFLNHLRIWIIMHYP